MWYLWRRNKTRKKTDVYFINIKDRASYPWGALAAAAIRSLTFWLRTFSLLLLLYYPTRRVIVRATCTYILYINMPDTFRHKYHTAQNFLQIINSECGYLCCGTRFRYPIATVLWSVHNNFENINCAWIWSQFHLSTCNEM